MKIKFQIKTVPENIYSFDQKIGLQREMILILGSAWYCYVMILWIRCLAYLLMSWLVLWNMHCMLLFLNLNGLAGRTSSNICVGSSNQSILVRSWKIKRRTVSVGYLFSSAVVTSQLSLWQLVSSVSLFCQSGSSGAKRIPTLIKSLLKGGRGDEGAEWGWVKSQGVSW